MGSPALTKTIGITRHLFRGTPRMGAADGDDYWHLPGDKVRCQR
jgi:hypothetical protein